MFNDFIFINLSNFIFILFNNFILTLLKRIYSYSLKTVYSYSLINLYSYSVRIYRYSKQAEYATQIIFLGGHDTVKPLFVF